MTRGGPPPGGRGSDVRTVLVWAGWVALYTVAAVAGRHSISAETGIALVWPAAGIGFAWTLWAWRRSGVTGAVVGAVGGGAVTGVLPLLHGVAPLAAACFGVAQTLMSVVAVAVYLRLDPEACLRSVRGLWSLLLAALAGSLGGAVVGPTTLVLLFESPLSTYPQWIVRNTVSLFVVVACLLAARHAPRGLRSPAGPWETGAAAVVSATAYVVLFGSDTRLPLSFAVLALSVWVGLRVGRRAAAALAAVGGTVVVLATATGTGPFTAVGGGTGVLLSQGFVAMMTLVTLALALQRDAQEALDADLGASEARFRSAFEAAPVSMLLAPLVDGVPGPTVRTNGALASFVGRPVDELVGTYAHDLVDERDRATLSSMLARLALGEQPERTELRFRHRTLGTVWGAVSLSRLSVSRGGGCTLLCLVEDITARKQAEAALSRQALHDSLTGLPNRSLLVDRLERAIRSTDSARAGVVYLDIDGFKAHNEQLGHAGGDDLLTRFGSRVAGCVGTIDTVARLGGDEFVILCEDLHGLSELEGIAERVRAAVLEPFHVAGAALAVSASLGVALAEPDEHPESVLRRAERLMSHAKNGGRLGSSQVSPEQARAARTLRLLPELERALAEDEFCMFGQPIVDVATGRTVAVETLLRWRHPQRGLLAPGEFLDVLENSSLMAEAGSRVLGLSLRMAREWWDVLGPEAPLVHVNVSGAQLQDGHLSEALRTAQAAAGVPMTQVVLELTETHAPLISDSLLSDVGNLRRDGVRIALDDLGTGYSSLQRITELPTDILKIDQRFVAGLGHDPRCSAIVRGVLSMSQALGLSVIAEGVETPEQHRLLRQHDCDTAQGYLYARPLPADELRDLLAAQRSLVPR